MFCPISRKDLVVTCILLVLYDRAVAALTLVVVVAMFARTPAHLQQNT